MSDEFFRNFPQYHFTYQYSGTRAELCHPTLPKDGRANMNAVAFAESKGWNFSETVFWHEAIVHFYWEEGSPNSEVIISSTLLPGWWVHVHVVRDDIHGFRENLSRFAEGNVGEPRTNVVDPDAYSGLVSSPEGRGREIR